MTNLKNVHKPLVYSAQLELMFAVDPAPCRSARNNRSARIAGQCHARVFAAGGGRDSSRCLDCALEVCSSMIPNAGVCKTPQRTQSAMPGSILTLIAPGYGFRRTAQPGDLPNMFCGIARR
jgi:hypothetical protein